MKRKSSVTQKQVAKEAGVSQTAVSLIFNGDTSIRINDDTRKHVLDIADKMGYVPQAAARSLVHGHSNNLALVLLRPHQQVFNDPYIPNIITGFSEVARKAGFRIVVEQIDDVSRLSVIRTMLKGGEVAGIVLNGSISSHQEITQLAEEGYPIVALGHGPNINPALHNINIDHGHGIKQMTKHLIGIGYQRIACISYAPEHDEHVQSRIAIFRQVLEAHNRGLEPTLIRYGNYDPESGYTAMKELLAQKQIPEAVYCMNDLMAMGAMSAIRDAGLNIPTDIAIVGYDGMRFAAFTAPPLTTVHAPEVEQGRLAADTLISLLANTKSKISKASNEKVQFLKPELVIRQSCGWQNTTETTNKTTSETTSNTIQSHPTSINTLSSSQQLLNK